jgi:nanoRNase/pAp phosphatase (c-di-AMP/oligoRNAs hydrolase)
VTLAVLYAEDGKISIRRRSGTNIRCDLIAYKLGGGGHSYAAAGIIELQRISNNIDRSKSSTRITKYSERYSLSTSLMFLVLLDIL